MCRGKKSRLQLQFVHLNSPTLMGVLSARSNSFSCTSLNALILNKQITSPILMSCLTYDLSLSTAGCER